MADSKQPFVHLHFHTAYSLLDGICRVGDAVEKAEALGMNSLAMTDHGVLYGTVDFYKTARARGIKPIIGCETYVASESRHDRGQPGRRSSGANHLVLLAEDDQGYANLVRLISMAHLEGFYYKPRIDLELLAQHHQGLIGLSACVKGAVSQRLVADDFDGALAAAGTLGEIFGPGNFYLEIEDHGLEDQKRVLRQMPELARRAGLPLVATNDVHYLEAGHVHAHDLMLCLQTQTVRSDPKRMRYHSDQFYMKSPAEMWALFGAWPEALRNTQLIADRCNVELHLGDESHFPLFQLPPETDDPAAYLYQLGAEGLRARFGLADPRQPKDATEKQIAERFFYELGVIERTRFVNYFLVVSDFVRFARGAGIPVGPGRGSGAGSLVAYALGITGLDPLKYNLIFERFLNPERVSPPDFDIDFCQARRGEVIEYVKNKYGRENVAQIITFGTLGAKTAFRDLGRVLEMPFGEVDRIAKLIPEDPKITLDKALADNPDFKRETESNPVAKQILPLARICEGLPRNASTHAAGVVIGEKPLIEIIPLARDKDGEPVTQFGMKPVEEVGLLKMDFLGLKTLTVIQETLANVKQTRGLELRAEDLPLDDPAAFDLLGRGDTVGVFQVESAGMRELLRRIGLSRFEELVAMIALYRPGPMNMLDDFVQRKHGKVPVTYEHPLLEPVLRETYGVMIYQEQVQQAANVLAGFTLGQGDILRRAMGKKNPAEMATQREAFIAGCLKANKIAAPLAGRIFDNIERFAGYGFNKSHSAAYAVISMQTAYLKAHYLVEFLAAQMSIEMGNAEKLTKFIGDAQQLNVAILPPDVNESWERFRPVKEAIRFGLAGIKNVGAGAVATVVAEREAHGPFEGLVDFCRRLDGRVVNRKMLESLIKCGAFDFTHVSRGRLFGAIDFALERAASEQRDRAVGQTSFFDLLEAPDPRLKGEDLPAGDPWPEHEMLAHEKELIGFYISGHPLQHHEWTLRQLTTVRVGALPEAPNGSLVRIGGLVTQYAKRFTKKDKLPMCSFRLEGLEGAIEVVLWPSAFEACTVALQDEALVMVCGRLEQGERRKVVAEEVYELSRAPALFAELLRLHLAASRVTPERLARLKALLAAHPGPVTVSLCLEQPTGERIYLDAGASCKVTPAPELIRTLNQELGEDSVYVQPKTDVFLRGEPERRWRRG
ncbi:MAG: DNA polymerase III subunit alpha [Candidatus Marinimicrobia bacterium]|nr:DNA polymerase III subunit alpha [Candidatus Neomarinimicrobiota bacterium]